MLETKKTSKWNLRKGGRRISQRIVNDFSCVFNLNNNILFLVVYSTKITFQSHYRCVPLQHTQNLPRVYCGFFRVAFFACKHTTTVMEFYLFIIFMFFHGLSNSRCVFPHSYTNKRLPSLKYFY